VFNPGEAAYLPVGGAFNRVYRTTRGKLLQGKRTGETLTEADLGVLRTQLDDFLNRYEPEEQGAILRAAWVDTYMGDDPSDVALWGVGEKTERGYLPGIAQKTLAALREAGILDEIAATNAEGVIRYPGAAVIEPTVKRAIGIQGVWFNHYCRQQAAQGQSIPATMGEVSRADSKAAKAQIEALAAKDWVNESAMIQVTHYNDRQGRQLERLGVFNLEGELLGLIPPEDAQRVHVGQVIELRFILAHEGNLRVIWEDKGILELGG
jgi:hypothetical protein